MRSAPTLTLAVAAVAGALAGIRRSHGAIMHLRIMLAPLLLAFAVLPPKTYAVSPAAKLFRITGSPPMQAIAVNTLSPSNSKHTKFSGGAQLQLADSIPLALVTKLIIKKSKGLYAFKSTGSHLPRFKGKITTIGEPESVRSVALTLTRGKRDKVRATSPTSVILAPSTTTTTLSMVVAPSTTTTTLGASPFIGEFTGTFAVTAGLNQGLTGQSFIVIGANGVAGAAFQIKGVFTGGMSGVANLVTGAVTLTQLSTQLSGHITVAVQLEASDSSVKGSGTITTSNNKGTTSGSGTITITTKENIASNYVGVYLGVLNITAGPDSPDNLPIELFVANDGAAGGDTFDPAGDGFNFQGTVNLTSGAFTLAVNAGKDSLAGITGTLIGNFVMPSLANGTFNLSNGDTGTVSFSEVAPSVGPIITTTTTTTSSTLPPPPARCCTPSATPGGTPSCQIETAPQCAADGGADLGPGACNPNPCTTAGGQCLVQLRAGDLESASQSCMTAAAADPQDAGAALLTVLTALVVQALDSPTLMNLIDGFGLIHKGSASDVCSLSVRRPPTFPVTAPRTGAIQAAARAQVITKADAALAMLDGLPSNLSVQFDLQDLPPCIRPRHVRGIEIDDGDVLTMKAALDLAAGSTHLIAAYDVDFDLAAFLNKTMTLQQEFTANRTLMTLLPTGTSELGAARTRLANSFTELAGAIDAISAETDDQSDDLLVIDAADAQKVKLARAALDRLGAALTGQATFEATIFGIPHDQRLSLKPLFDGTVADLRPLAPPFDAKGNPDFSQVPDPTFGGMAPDMTQAELSRLLHLHSP